MSLIKVVVSLERLPFFYAKIYYKTIYSHKNFYEASGNSKCDVFKCLENRKLYLPAENELFEYTGKFIEHKEPEKTAQQPKKKSKSQKERER